MGKTFLIASIQAGPGAGAVAGPGLVGRLGFWVGAGVGEKLFREFLICWIVVS